MNISSYTAQLGLNDSQVPVCVMLITDGIAATAPEKDQAVSARLTGDQLTITYGSETLNLTKLAPELCKELNAGKPLVLKHEASSYEALVPVTL